MVDKDKLLIVFSNYNGFRITNDLSEPRIGMTIESFRRHIGDWADWNVLLLDNNSTDGSQELLAKYASESEKWMFVQKKSEDYYLGTMRKLICEYNEQFEYLMLVDNDQYFFRSNFLEQSLNFFEQRHNIGCLHLDQTSIIDTLDYGKKKIIDGIFDKVVTLDGSTFGIMAKPKYLRRHKWFKPTNRGMGTIFIKKHDPKRACWLYFAPSNLIIRLSIFVDIFQDDHFKPPYSRNGDRVNSVGRFLAARARSAMLVPGVSINIGPRKYLKKDFKLQPVIDQYENGDFSKGIYFILDKRLQPLELSDVKN